MTRAPASPSALDAVTPLTLISAAHGSIEAVYLELCRE